MIILCKLFGHTIRQYSYGKFWGGTTDGIEREHGFYKGECERCGEPVNLYVHFPENVLERNQTKNLQIGERKNERII